MTALREQVMAVPIPTHVDDRLTIADVIRQDRLRVLVVFAERERLLRERIEALPDLDIQGTAWVQTEHVLEVFDA